jgi:subtilisin family serine protease
VLRSGTSFAAAIVTGVVASVLAASPTSLDPSSVVDAVARQSDLVDGVHLVGARPVVDGAGTTPGHATEPVGSCRAPEG